MNAIESINWQAIKVISFDLDDTLWDNSGVIDKCLQELYKFLCDKEPLIQKHFTVKSMERITEQLIQLEKPEYENMTVLRKTVIKTMLQEVGGDESLVNPAFAIFYHWRNQISVPEITFKVLDYLKEKYILVATSNGNSNLKKVQLDGYFDLHFIAGIHGRAKPSPEMLNRIREYYQISTNEIIHIGDNEETDIMSANNAKVESLKLLLPQISELLSV